MVRHLVLATALAFSMVAGTGSHAAVIHGCYLESTGALRVLVETQRTAQCKSNERPIEWNQEGPPGPAGPAGPAGPTGPAGPPGNPSPSSQILNAQSVVPTDAPTSIGDLAGLGKQLTVSFDARIFAFAEVHVLPSVGAPPYSGFCQLFINDGTGPQTNLSQMDQAVSFVGPLGSGQLDLTIPIGGVSMKPAGTYNIMVECQNFQPGAIFKLTELMVWTAAQ